MADDIQAQIGVGADTSGAVSDVQKLLKTLSAAIEKAELLQKRLEFKPRGDANKFFKDLEKTLAKGEEMFKEAGAKGFRTALAEVKTESLPDRRVQATLSARKQTTDRIDADLENSALKIADAFTKTLERRFTANAQALEARLNQTFTKSLESVGVYGGRSQANLTQLAAENVAANRQREARRSIQTAPIIGLSTEDIRNRELDQQRAQAERDNLARDIRRSRQIAQAEAENARRDQAATAEQRALDRQRAQAERDNALKNIQQFKLQAQAEAENARRDAKAAQDQARADKQRFQAERDNLAFDLRRDRQRAQAERANAAFDARAERASAPRAAAPTPESRARSANELTLARLNLDGGASFLAVQGRILANYVLLNQAYQVFTGTIAGVIELEKELKQFQAITQTTNTEMATFERTLLTIASSSKFTAVEVAQAATTMGQAGLSAKQVGESINAVINLATASGSTLKESVDTVTSVLGVFNLNASEAARVANVLTSGLNLSKLTMDKLALGIQYAGNVAHDAGLSFTELTATLGGLANAGIRNGSTLGTGVRQILLDLQNPTEKFKKVMNELGITLADIDVKSHGLTGVFENLQKKGFTSADAMRSLETRAVAAFSAINNNLGTIKSFESQMLLSDAATAGANKQMESFANTWSKFVSTLSSAAYTGFKPALTFLQGLTSAVTSLFAGLEKIPGALQAVTTALVALAGSAALSSVVGTLRNFSLIGGAITGLGTLATLFTGLSGAFGTITTLTAGISTLGTALAGLVLTPVGAFVTGITLLAGAFVALKAVLPDVEAQLDKVNAKINEAKGRYDQTKTTITSLDEAIEKLYRRQEQLKNDPVALRNAITEAREAFSKFGLQLGANVKSVDDLIEAYNRLRRQQLNAAPAELAAQQRAEQEKLELERKKLNTGRTVETNIELYKLLGARSPFGVRDTANEKLGPSGGKLLDIVNNPQNFGIEDLRSVQGDLRSRARELQIQLDTEGEKGPNAASLREKIKIIDDVLKLVDERFGGVLSSIKQSEIRIDDIKRETAIADIRRLGPAANPQTPGDSLGFSQLNEQLGKIKQQQIDNLTDLVSRKNDSGSLEDFRSGQRTASLAADAMQQSIDQLALRLKREGFKDTEIDSALAPLREKVAETRNLFLASLNSQTEAYIEAQRKILSQEQKRINREIAEIEKRAGSARSPADLDKIYEEVKAKRAELDANDQKDIELQFLKDQDFNERKQRLEELNRQTAADLKRTQETFQQRNNELVKKAMDDLIHEVEAQIKSIGKQIAEIRNRIKDQHLTGDAATAAQNEARALSEQAAELENRKSDLTNRRNNLGQPIEATNSKQQALIQAAQSLGIDPRDLAAAISYETGGTFDPSIRGGKNNKHIGLIQFGEDEQKQFGANQFQTFEDQMVAVVKYLRTRGLKPGSGIEEIYRTINGGNPGASLNASDGNGTIREHVGKITGGHYGNADKFLSGAGATASERTEAERQQGLAASRRKEQADVTDDIIRNLDRKVKQAEQATSKTVSTSLSQASSLRPEQVLETTIPRIRKAYDELQDASVNAIQEEIDRRKKLGESTIDLEDKLREQVEKIAKDRQAKLTAAAETYERRAKAEAAEPVKEAQKTLDQLQIGAKNGTVDQLRVENAQRALEQRQREQTAADVEIQKTKERLATEDQASAASRSLAQTGAQRAQIEQQLYQVEQQRIALQQSGLLSDSQLQDFKRREAELSQQLAEAKEREKQGTQEKIDADNRAKTAVDDTAEAQRRLAASTQAAASSAAQFAQAGVNSFLKSNNVIGADGSQLSFLQSMAKETQSILSSISSKFADTFTGILTGTKKGAKAWKEMLASMLSDLTKMLVQKAFAFLISGMFGGAGGGLGGGIGGLFGGLFGGAGKSLGGSMFGYPTIGRFASGGPVPNRDSVPALLTPGEIVMRKSAVDMVGRDNLLGINNMGNRKRSEGNIRAAESSKPAPQPFNFWLVQKDQVPPPGPRDMVAAIADDVLRGGQTKQLIRSVALGQV